MHAVPLYYRRVVLMLLALLMAATTPIALQAETLHYWRFEDSPGFLVDSIGSGDLAGSASQALLPEVGRGAAFPYYFSVSEGGDNAFAAEFNGSLSSLSTTIEPIEGDFTVEAFVHLDTATAFHAACIVCVDTDPRYPATSKWFFEIRLDDQAPQPGELILVLSDSTSWEVIGSGFILSTGVDYYVAAALDLDGGFVTFYLQDLTNGGVLQSVTQSHSTSVLNPISSPLAIGDDVTGYSV